jgi:very-short-patch-repair endonuclease
LIVEVDGGQHAEQILYDGHRARWLEAQGYLVLRFWNNEVLAHTEAVTQAILDCLEGRQ